MKKIELNLDAIIIVVVVFVLAFGFIIYQRHQFSRVMQENIDITWEFEKMKANLTFKNNKLEICEAQIEMNSPVTPN